MSTRARGAPQRQAGSTGYLDHCRRLERILDQVLSKKSYRIGIDVGGTFTKAALIDSADGSVVGRSSVHTTHDHPDGVAAGVIQVFEQVLGDAGIEARDVVLLAHSTTQATNAPLEGAGARVGIVGLSGAKAAKLAQAQG